MPTLKVYGRPPSMLSPKANELRQKLKERVAAIKVLGVTPAQVSVRYIEESSPDLEERCVAFESNDVFFNDARRDKLATKQIADATGDTIKEFFPDHMVEGVVRYVGDHAEYDATYYKA